MGKRVVIDRCNVSRIQRQVWLGVADELQICAGCIWLDVNQEECGSRVLRRFGHQTLPAESSSLEVIAAFRERLEAPMEAEGFVLWRSRCQDELESAVEEIQELADRSEVDFAEAGGAEGLQQYSGRCEDMTYHGQMNHTNGGNFRYREVRGRGFRGKYLRGVRRQVEYYFCDSNLRQDWFFQEKIAAEPESGWLELRWLLSCPRIRDVHQANDADVLEALGPSSLMVKRANDTLWIRRGRPLPPLSEPRPAKGKEPEWYKALHGDEISVGPVQTSSSAQAHNSFAELGDQDREHPRCARCGKNRLKSDFTKAQLTKHRKSPACKDCVVHSSE